MFIVVYERFRKRDGTMEDRPLAMFRNLNEANVFLGMLASAGRRIYAKTI
ncbi:MAG: hypothetical protein Q7J68_02095 [Thermoplasmata archaeon]|nr:hypothetical protein [Thermoplasmata archaeon]